MSILEEENNNNLNSENEEINDEINEKPNPHFSIDIINAFGANCSSSLGEPVNFISKNKYIIYNAGRHLIYRELSYNDNTTQTLAPLSSQSKQTNLNLIYLDKNSKEITSLNVSEEKSLFAICENLEDNLSTITIYFLAKINFKKVVLYQPSRKIITDKYCNFKNISFSSDDKFIIATCYDKKEKKYKGIIYDIQIYKFFKLNLTLPSIIFDIDEKVSKISYKQKIICTSGKFNINFWNVYQNSTREIKTSLSQNKNYIDHSFVKGDDKNLILIALTSENEIFIIEGYDKNKQFIKNSNENDSITITQFTIKQYLNNIFNNTSSIPTRLKVLKDGIIVGNDKGDLLFLEKTNKNAINENENNIINDDNKIKNNQEFVNKLQKYKIINQYTSGYYIPIRIIHREINSSCTGLTCSFNEDMLLITYKNNEIIYCEIKDIFFYLKDNDFNINFHILCEGFHSGNITSIDTSIQRPIIVSASNIDKTIRIWNYLSGHSEFAKIILTESEEHHIYNFNILSLALHPNGYYLAIADLETIWFFHLCYRELRFYGTDIVKQNETRREKCHILKFSNGGHLLCAVSGKNIYLLKSYTRDLICVFYTEHIDKIGDITFSDDDKYIFSFGTDGFIFQINLFTLEIDKIIGKYINFTCCLFYSYINDNSDFHIIGCGKDKMGKYTINEINFKQKNIHHNYDDIIINEDNYFITKDKINCLIYINSSRIEIEGLICGTLDGKIIVYPFPIHKNTIKIDEINVHKGKVNQILFNRDSSLIFSSGDDGNIFVLCLFELKGNNEFHYDNRIRGIKQLTISLDSGLGENVLFPINELEKMQILKNEKKNILNKFEGEREKLNKEMEMKLRFLGNNLNAKKNLEMKELNEKILELDLKNKELINHYENKIQEIIESNRKKYNEQNKLSQEEIKNLREEIIKLEKEIKNLNELSLKKKEETTKVYEERFLVLEKELKKEVNSIIKEKEKLNENISDLKKEQNQVIKAIDFENELEKNIFIEKQNLKEKNLEKIIDTQSYEITKLKDLKMKLEEDSNKKEREIKLLNEKNEYLIKLVSLLKSNLNKASNEREDFIKKTQELEKKIQEIEKVEKYSHKLKNEMYKKNIEISSLARKTEIQNEKYANENKQLIHTVNLSLTQIDSIEKEKNKLEILINNYKIENENIRKKYNIFQGIFDKLLFEIYKSVQTNNKNEVYRCVSNIYKNYITEEFIDKIKKKQLNFTIQEELEYQINYLQNSLFIGGKNNESMNKLHQVFKNQKIKENSVLIENFSQIRKKSMNLSKDIIILKGYNNSLKKQISNLKSLQVNLPKLKKSNSTENIQNINFTKDSKSYNDELEILSQIKDNYITIENNKSILSEKRILKSKENNKKNIIKTSQNPITDNSRSLSLIQISKI